MPTFDELDAITIDQLRGSGATKWNRDDGAIGVFTAEMDFGVAQPVKDRLHSEVDNGLFAYLPPHYRTEMQQSVAAYLKSKHSWEVPPERIHEMPDVVAAYRAAYQHFSKAGSKIIVPTPSYMPFLFVPPMDGREVIEVPMSVNPGDRSFSHDLDAIEDAFDHGGNLLVLCNPHNPTGRVFSRDELKAIEELVDRKGGRVFSDEIWMPLVYQPNTHISYASISPKTAEHTVTATAASKGFNLPGLKCAQLITSNDADEEKWENVGFIPMHGAANLGLVATATAFAQGSEWLDDILSYLKRNRDSLTSLVGELMPKAKVTVPEGTYVAWIDFSEYGIDGNLQDFFLENAGVMCTEGTACGEVGQGHVRFIFAMPHPILIDALERMAKALTTVSGNI